MSIQKLSYLWQLHNSPPYHPKIHIAIINSIIKQCERPICDEDGHTYRMSPGHLIEIFGKAITESDVEGDYSVCGGWSHYSDEGVKALDSTHLIRDAIKHNCSFRMILETSDDVTKEIVTREIMNERKKIGLTPQITELLQRFLVDVHVSCYIYSDGKKGSITWPILRKIILHYYYVLTRKVRGRDYNQELQFLHKMIDGNDFNMQTLEYESFGPFCSSLTDDVIIDIFPVFTLDLKSYGIWKNTYVAHYGSDWIEEDSDSEEEEKLSVRDHLKSVIETLDDVKDLLPEDKYLDMMKKLHLAHASS